MTRASLVAGLVALAVFAYAQVAGWNLFDREAGAQTARLSSGRTFHK